MEPVIIKSNRGGRSLVLSNRDGDYFDAELTGDSLSAKKGIWGYTDTNDLVKLFASLAEDWRGWDGERHWASIEGDIDLTATSDKLGHVRLDVVILNNHPEDDWQVNAPIHLDAGELDRLASQVHTFFNH